MSDPMLSQVKDYIKGRKKISSRVLIKKFGIGYSRASLILDYLAKYKVVTKAVPKRARKVL